MRDDDRILFDTDWMQPGMVVIDLETTGLSKSASVIEACAVNWRGEWIHTFHRPRPGCQIEPKALEVNGRDIRALDACEIGYYQGMEDFLGWLDVCREEHGQQLVIAGMNVHFDLAFLRRAWAELREGREPVSHRVYDLHTLATAYLDLFSDTRPDKLHSDALSEALRISPEAKPHTAVRGCEWAIRAFATIHSNLNKLKESLS